MASLQGNERTKHCLRTCCIMTSQLKRITNQHHYLHYRYRKQILRNYYMPGPVLSVLHVSTHSVLTVIL